MTEQSDHEARIAALEAIVTALQAELADLRKRLPAAPSAKPELRSRGMLDRPKTGR